MSAQTPTDQPIAQVQARQTDNGPMVCVTDRRVGLQMCYPLLETMEIAARMVDCAGGLIAHAMHEANKQQPPAIDGPPPVRLFVPR